MVRAGTLDQEMLLQSPSTDSSRGSAGGRNVGFSTTERVWAGTVDAGGREDRDGAKMGGELQRTFRLRYRNGVTSDYRLVDAGSTDEVWDIKAAYDPTGNRRELHVEAVRLGV